MSWLRNVPPIARALRALERRAQVVWSRDRSSLRGAAAFGNRAFRIAFLAVPAFAAEHRISSAADLAKIAASLRSTWSLGI